MNASTDNFDPEFDTEPEKPLLPQLSSKPAVHPGCCLALSAPLLAHLHTLLTQAPALTLSIGSGYGLLEGMLLGPPYNVNIVGVEVQPSPNTYLPTTHHRTVAGSRFLEPLAEEAEVWLFVYPRRVGLVEQYLGEYGKGKVEMVMWIGPTADWQDYKSVFEGWFVEARCADEVGGREWEIIAVAQKKPGEASFTEGAL